MRIGFIGIGIMGSRMAGNLLRAGYGVTLYNRSQNAAQSLLEKGATWSQSPKEMAGQVDAVITMVPTPEDIRQVSAGENGFLNHMGPNTLWINCSTVNPSFAKGMALLSQEKGVRFIDAPVAGTKGPAEKGELLFLVGGKTADVDECRPLFDVMGRGVVHAGDTGMGSAMKMLVNLMLGAGMAAFSEALVLGESMGLSRKQLLESLIGTPVVPPFIAGKREKIENDDYSPEFPLEWMQKDLHLGALTAYEQGVGLPVLNTVKELFAMAKAGGEKRSDFSAIYRFMTQGE